MDQDSRAKKRRGILAGIAGNVMEWYDFTVYGYFAAVIGRQFFPAEDPISSLLAAFGVFAAGFLMRPFGSLIFGHIGDKMGRKAALTASVALMAVPTFLIGLLPTYQQIGIAGSALLVLLRLVQGLSVGGEYTTSAIFLVERSTPGHRGFLGSFGPFGACGGVLLGSAIGALVTSVLEPASVQSWGWRVPFVLGITVGLCGLYLRRQIVEDTVPQAGFVRQPRQYRKPFAPRGAASQGWSGSMPPTRSGFTFALSISRLTCARPTTFQRPRRSTSTRFPLWR